MNASNTTLVVVAVIVLVVIGLIWLAARRRKTARLRSSFGPEYDRAVETADSRRKAEADLHARQKRVSKFELTPLNPTQRGRFVDEWRNIQAEFVDDPKRALARGDDLLTDVMAARGYPMSDFEQRSADLSVDHPAVVQRYRAGHEIALRHKAGQATTEDLRQAMIHYRSLFDELVGEGDAPRLKKAS